MVGWPDPLESETANFIRNSTEVDTKIRDLFDQLEREIMLHRNYKKTNRCHNCLKAIDSDTWFCNCEGK
jgi:predicted ABC-class ATPase